MNFILLEWLKQFYSIFEFENTFLFVYNILVMGSIRFWKQLGKFINFDKSSITNIWNGQIEKTRFVLGQRWQSANGRNDKTRKDINLKCETSWDNDVDQNSLDYWIFFKTWDALTVNLYYEYFLKTLYAMSAMLLLHV